MRRHLVPLVLLSLAPAAVSAQAADRAAFLAWARTNARPIASTEPAAPNADLAPLDRIVGRARIVGLGESAHGIHEFLGLRYRIARYLIERRGFTAVALETGLPDARAVYDYVLGGEPAADLWTKSFTWGMGAHAETREFIEWIRARNREPGQRRKIRFYGMDVAGGNGGWSGALDQVLSFLDRAEPPFAATMRERLVPLVAKFAKPEFTAANEAFGALPEADRNAVAALVSELADRFDLLRVSYLRTAPAEDYDWARQTALNLRLAGTMVVNFEGRNRPNPVWNARDFAMARNVLWIRKREGAGGGVVVLAHNAHVQTAMSTEVAPNMSSLGVFLKALVPNDYRNVGFAFGRGAMQGGAGPAATLIPLPPADSSTLDGTLARVGSKRFLLDLGAVPAGSAARRWLDQPIRQRIQTASTTYNQIQSWNALVFVDSITPGRLPRP
jgi:erythromycin esterase